MLSSPQLSIGYAVNYFSSKGIEYSKFGTVESVRFSVIAIIY